MLQSLCMQVSHAAAPCDLAAAQDLVIAAVQVAEVPVVVQIEGKSVALNVQVSSVQTLWTQRRRWCEPCSSS